MNKWVSYFIKYNKYFLWCVMKVITCRDSRVHVHNNVPATCGYLPVCPYVTCTRPGKWFSHPVMVRMSSQSSLHDRVKMYVLQKFGTHFKWDIFTFYSFCLGVQCPTKLNTTKKISIYLIFNFFSIILCLINEFKRIVCLRKDNIISHSNNCLYCFKTLQKGFRTTFLITFSFYQMEMIFCTYMSISSLMSMNDIV